MTSVASYEYTMYLSVFLYSKLTAVLQILIFTQLYLRIELFLEYHIHY